jgi:hypothetical protein
MPTHDHGCSDHHTVIGIELLNLAERQDIHLHITAGDLVRDCLGDLDGRTGHCGVGNKNLFHTRLSLVSSEQLTFWL